MLWISNFAMISMTCHVKVLKHVAEVRDNSAGEKKKGVGGTVLGNLNQPLPNWAGAWGAFQPTSGG